MDKYPWDLALAESRGWPREAHRIALETGNEDLIALTHPTNYLNEDEVEKPKPEHEHGVFGYGPHPWSCPACVRDSEDRKAYREDPNNNPHRAGTKAAAKWLSDRARLDWAMDLRSETYWSM